MSLVLAASPTAVCKISGTELFICDIKLLTIAVWSRSEVNTTNGLTYIPCSSRMFGCRSTIFFTILRNFELSTYAFRDRLDSLKNGQRSHPYRYRTFRPTDLGRISTNLTQLSTTGRPIRFAPTHWYFWPILMNALVEIYVYSATRAHIIHG